MVPKAETVNGNVHRVWMCPLQSLLQKSSLFKMFLSLSLNPVSRSSWIRPRHFRQSTLVPKSNSFCHYCVHLLMPFLPPSAATDLTATRNYSSGPRDWCALAGQLQNRDRKEKEITHTLFSCPDPGAPTPSHEDELVPKPLTTPISFIHLQ